MHISTCTLLFSLLSIVLAKIPHEPGWKFIWGDDFGGPNHKFPNQQKWNIVSGHSYPGGPANWGTGEIEYYLRHRKNVKVKNGMLYITPIKDASTGAWYSGRIESKRGDFKAEAGGKLKIQGEIAIPNVNTENGLGYWPAFWAMGSSFRNNYTNWPQIGEWDIMENVNGLDSTSATFHCGVDPGGYCNEPIGLGGRGPCRKGNCNGHFQKYSVVIDRSRNPETIEFFVDGKLRQKASSAEMDASTWANAMYDGHYIILNVAMGGQYPNGLYTQAGGSGTTPTAATVSGRSMKVKYVAVYKS